MNEENKFDHLDEFLKTFWLEAAENFDSDATKKSVDAIMSASYSVKMSDSKKQELITKLSSTLETASLGQLIRKAIDTEQVTEEDLAKESQLPSKMVSDLENDRLFPNNIPVFLLRNLLLRLNISYMIAKNSILKTFEIMKNRELILSSSSHPAFRRAQSNSKESFLKINQRVDGKELFENEDALNKYLSKLEELMK